HPSRRACCREAGLPRWVRSPAASRLGKQPSCRCAQRKLRALPRTVTRKPMPMESFSRTITPMKPAKESRAFDKAVHDLAKATEEGGSRHSRQEQAQRLRDVKKLLASLRKRKPAKSSRPPQARPDRRRALERG